MAGAIAEIAREALRRRVRSDRAADCARRAARGRPDDPARVTSESLRDSARRALAGLGVEVRERAIGDRSGRAPVAVGEERIAAGTVVWAAGVQASPLGRTLGAPVDRLGRVEVQPGPVDPGAPGGVRRRRSHAQARRRRPPGSRGRAGGDAGGRAPPRPMRCGVLRRPGRRRLPLSRSGQHGDDRPGPRHRRPGWIRLTGYPAWLAWLFLHLLFLIGFKNRVVVLLQWMVAYVTRQRGVRLITGDDDWRNRTRRP